MNKKERLIIKHFVQIITAEIFLALLILGMIIFIPFIGGYLENENHDYKTSFFCKEFRDDYNPADLNGSTKEIDHNLRCSYINLWLDGFCWLCIAIIIIFCGVAILLYSIKLATYLMAFTLKKVEERVKEELNRRL